VIANLFNNTGSLIANKSIITNTSSVSPGNNYRVDGLTNNKYVICMSGINDQNVFYGIINEDLTFH
jgi:hypothetical protein